MTTIDSLLRDAEQCVNGRRYTAALELLSPAMDSLRRDEAPNSLCHALLITGTSQYELGLITEARKLFEEGLEVSSKTKGTRWTPIFLHELSLVAYKEGELADSISYCEKSIELMIDNAFVKIGQGLTSGYTEYDLNILGGPLNHLCVLYQEAGNHDRALDLLNMLRANCERTYNIDLLGTVLHELALASFATGRYADGINFFTRSIMEKKKIGNLPGIRNSLMNLQACLLRYPESLKDPKVLSSLRDKGRD